MNRLLSSALGQRTVRATSARALAALPGSHTALRVARTPAQEPFIAFVDALRSTEPNELTQCDAWTVHELTAHLAAGSAELADLIELELSSASSRATRDFEEREAPYRALCSSKLRRAFFEEALRATVAVDQLAASRRCVAFTGVVMDADTVILHIESELVLHCWDIVGSDPASIAALSDARLAVHAATTVSTMSPNVFPPRSGDHETVVLRAAGGPDIAVTGGPRATAIALAPRDHSYPIVECHPAARTLMLWGRSPGAGLPYPVGDPAAVEAVVAMLLPASGSTTPSGETQTRSPTPDRRSRSEPRR
ncbi:MAG: hypothetical protein QOH60_2292 [Mycobacterium sp.]|jgi:hypothetical protein|nr:hypothetical protein [Mycobacterium sp.]